MMLTIEYVPSVLEALEVAFPTPPNRAKQQLDKYLVMLEKEMRLSLLNRSVFARRFGAYDIPLTKLINQSPTINNKRWRVHEWLGKHGHALVENINKNANNISKEIAILKPTANLIVNNDNLLKHLKSLSANELDTYLNSLTQDWQLLIADYQQHYKSLSANERRIQYFTSPVDISALKRYMTEIVNGTSTLKKSQQENSLLQAEYVLRLAQVNNGLLYQKIDKKAFGRTYYEGVNVLSVRKELRMAFLGKAWEYDCKSCSTAWKMSFANEWHSLKKRQTDVRHAFPAMTLYLEDKEVFFNYVIQYVFPQHTKQDYKPIIKEAMTALGFGAKLSIGKWRDYAGLENQSSLFAVFDEDVAVLKRFVSCDLVQKFNKEQQTLSKFIVTKFSGDTTWQAEMATEQLRKKLSKSFSQAQKIVWLYQHAETIMMDIVRYEVKKSGNTVLANVHDAVVVRDQITANLLARIERKVQKRTGVAYFKLGETSYL